MVQVEVWLAIAPAQHTRPAVALAKADGSWRRDIRLGVGAAGMPVSPWLLPLSMESSHGPKSRALRP
jgi:hypothetical protein